MTGRKTPFKRSHYVAPTKVLEQRSPRFCVIQEGKQVCWLIVMCPDSKLTRFIATQLAGPLGPLARTSHALICSSWKMLLPKPWPEDFLDLRQISHTRPGLPPITHPSSDNRMLRNLLGGLTKPGVVVGIWVCVTIGKLVVFSMLYYFALDAERYHSWARKCRLSPGVLTATPKALIAQRVPNSAIVARLGAFNGCCGAIGTLGGIASGHVGGTCNFI